MVELLTHLSRGLSPHATAPEEERRAELSELPLPEVGLALASIGGGFASLALGIGTFAVPGLQQFFTKNTAAAVLRNQLTISLMAAAAVPLLVAVASLLIKRRRAVPGLVQVGHLVSPLCLAAFVPTLLAFRTWHDNPLPYLLMLAAFGLAGERLFDRALRAVPSAVTARLASMALSPAAARWVPLAVVVAGGVAYSVYFSYYTMMNHRRFQTSGFDLGINVNWCYNALHGHPFRCTVLFGPNGGNFIAGHAIFAMAIWLPFFAIHQGPETFLIYQSVVCGMAAIPLFLFAKNFVPRWTAVVVAFAYLFYALLHGPNFYDYHELPVAIIFHFFFYWAIATKRYRWIPVFLVILYAHREDMAVGIAFLGTFLMLSGARPKLGLALSVVSVIWFIIIKFIIMPWAGQWWFAGIYKDLQAEGASGYGTVVQTMLVNPAYFLSTLFNETKLIYFLHVFAPLAFLPLRRPLLAFLAFPGFFFTLMTTGYPPTLSIAFQYTTHWVPYVFAATVLSLKLLNDTHGPTRRRAATIALAMTMGSHSLVFGAVLQHDTMVGGFNKIEFKETDEEKKAYADFKKLVSVIPREASVAASENEIAHLSSRLNAYTLKDYHGDADYLLIRSGRFDKKLVDEVFSRNKYGLVGQSGRMHYLFKKDHSSPDTERAKTELGIR